MLDSGRNGLRLWCLITWLPLHPSGPQQPPVGELPVFAEGGHLSGLRQHVLSLGTQGRSFDRPVEPRVRDDVPDLLARSKGS